MWKALTTHLEYFGVITRARLQVEKAQKIQVKVTFHDEKELFESNAKGAYMQTSRRVITVSITGIQP
ncbi:MAG: hypothetical protein ACI86X_002327 [Moritella sp.]|jgi:hypothetical protein